MEDVLCYENSREMIMEAYDEAFPLQESKYHDSCSNTRDRCDTYQRKEVLINESVDYSSRKSLSRLSVADDVHPIQESYDDMTSDYRDRAFYAEAALEILQQHVMELSGMLANMKKYESIDVVKQQQELLQLKKVLLYRKKEIEKTKTTTKSVEKVLRTVTSEYMAKKTQTIHMQRELDELKANVMIEAEIRKSLDHEIVRLTAEKHSISDKYTSSNRCYQASYHELTAKLRYRSKCIWIAALIAMMIIIIWWISNATNSILINNLYNDAQLCHAEYDHLLQAKKGAHQLLAVESNKYHDMKASYDDLICDTSIQRAQLELEIRRLMIIQGERVPAKLFELIDETQSNQPHVDGVATIFQHLLRIDRMFSSSYDYQYHISERSLSLAHVHSRLSLTVSQDHRQLRHSLAEIFILILKDRRMRMEDLVGEMDACYDLLGDNISTASSCCLHHINAFTLLSYAEDWNTLIEDGAVLEAVHRMRGVGEQSIGRFYRDDMINIITSKDDDHMKLDSDHICASLISSDSQNMIDYAGSDLTTLMNQESQGTVS